MIEKAKEKVIIPIPSTKNTSIVSVECIDSETPVPVSYESQLLGAVVYPKEHTVFFYGGIFSQWAECKFHSQSLGIDVNCAEQAMMLHKAKLFKDEEAYDAILKSDNPRVQKAIGRQIKNWNDEEWNKVKYDIVLANNYDKFGQNKGWKELLFFTHPYELVETSPTDRIWGIGFSVDSAHLFERELWGQNLLGKAIDEARQRLIDELP